MKYVGLESDAFLRDPDFVCMTCEERGAYVSLIMYLTSNNGEIVLNDNDNKVVIGSLIGSCQNVELVWTNIAHKFTITDGVLSHKRVTKEIDKAENRRLQASEAGKRGMAKRWKDKKLVDNVRYNDLITDLNLNINSSLNKNSKENQNGEVVLFQEQDFADAGALVGLTPKQSSECYDHYVGQQFKYGNGLPIRKAIDACKRWRNNQNKFSSDKATDSTADIVAQLKAKGEL